MLNAEEYQQLLNDIQEEFPNFKVVKKKDSLLMKTINVFLKGITFGKMNSFMEGFITTIGTTVYVPSSWDEGSPSTKAITMRHERVHMRQAKEKGRVLFSLQYLLLPFPVGVAYYRMRFEQEAYEESLKAYYEYYGNKFTPALKQNIVEHFTTAEYFWMWPWKAGIEKWYDKVVANITKK